MEETIATIATMATEPLEFVVEATEAVTEAAEAFSGLMEELAPVYEIMVTGCNLITICICALGLVAGILLGVALRRWLK